METLLQKLLKTSKVEKLSKFKLLLFKNKFIQKYFGKKYNIEQRLKNHDQFLHLESLVNEINEETKDSSDVTKIVIENMVSRLYTEQISLKFALPTHNTIKSLIMKSKIWIEILESYGDTITLQPMSGPVGLVFYKNDNIIQSAAIEAFTRKLNIQYPIEAVQEQFDDKVKESFRKHLKQMMEFEIGNELFGDIIRNTMNEIVTTFTTNPINIIENDIVSEFKDKIISREDAPTTMIVSEGIGKLYLTKLVAIVGLNIPIVTVPYGVIPADKVIIHYGQSQHKSEFIIAPYVVNETVGDDPKTYTPCISTLLRYGKHVSNLDNFSKTFEVLRFLDISESIKKQEKLIEEQSVVVHNVITEPGEYDTTQFGSEFMHPTKAMVRLEQFFNEDLNDYSMPYLK